jgi:hypothetical protein
MALPSPRPVLLPGTGVAMHHAPRVLLQDSGAAIHGRSWRECCFGGGNDPILPGLDHLGLRSGELGWSCGGGKCHPLLVIELLPSVVPHAFSRTYYSSPVRRGKVSGRVKTLLSAFGAERGDTCGCHYFL